MFPFSHQLFMLVLLYQSHGIIPYLQIHCEAMAMLRVTQGVIETWGRYERARAWGLRQDGWIHCGMMAGWIKWCVLFSSCLVVSMIFYFHPYLGKWSNLTNMGWNHQLLVLMLGSTVNSHDFFYGMGIKLINSIIDRVDIQGFPTKGGMSLSPIYESPWNHLTIPIQLHHSEKPFVDMCLMLIWNGKNIGIWNG